MENNQTNLTDVIKYHQNQYYNNNSKISDDEFDILWGSLSKSDPNNEIFNTIGKDENVLFEKTKHRMVMGSLNKASNETQFRQWIKKHTDNYYVVQHKLDGISLELQYTNGILTAAVTRGNGYIGDNIYKNAQFIKGVITKLQHPITVAIRGEVVITHENYKKYFNNSTVSRSVVNGIVKRKDNNDAHLLDFFAYDIHYFGNDFFTKSLYEMNEIEKLTNIERLGFNPVTYTKLLNYTDINNYRKTIFENRASLGVDVDGIVIKTSLMNKDDMQLLRPTRQLAYKFPLQSMLTKITDIKWSEEGHRYIPIAILEPINICGTEVKRVNLINVNHIKEMRIGIGAEVLISKRGEIVPKIEKVTSTDHEEYREIPTHCVTCNTLLNNTGTDLYCPNFNCDRRIVSRFIRWCSALKIRGWGNTLIQNIVTEFKWVKRIGDLYRLTVEDLTTLCRVETKTATKLINALHSKKKITFSDMLGALKITGIAEITAKKLVKNGCNNWQSLKKTKLSEATKMELVILDDEIEDLYNYVNLT